MGGMVRGLVSHTSATEMGRFTRTTMAMAAAMSICMGAGMKAQNSPTETAPLTERLLRCQRLGSWRRRPKTRM